MSASAQALRLYILMASPDITWVFDRLRVLGLIVKGACLRCARDDGAFLAIDLGAIEDGPAKTLVLRLQQIPTVRRVRARRNITETPRK